MDGYQTEIFGRFCRLFEWIPWKRLWLLLLLMSIATVPVFLSETKKLSGTSQVIFKLARSYF